MMLNHTIHPDLLEAQKLIYEPNGLIVNAIVREPESKEYGAYTFKINDKIIKFRTAKITPKKIGQFVTIWKRIGCGPILPYDLADPIDRLVASVRARQNFGQFVFPKDVLWKKGFVSKDGKGGKLAMRVYPPWDTPDSLQAKKTQAWQLMYFVEFQPDLDSAKIRNLFL